MRQRTSDLPAAFAAALLAIVPALSGCSGEPPQAQASQAPVAVAVARPLVRRITDWDDYTGRFEPVDAVEVRARVSGYLQSIHFRDGEMVRKGQLLFVIDPRPYQAALAEADGRLAEARSRATLARQNLERAEPLRADQILPKSTFDEREQAVQGSRASIATAAAQVQRARLDLSFTRVYAPMSGRISRKLVSIGNLVDGGAANATLLTTIVTTNPIEIAFNVDEQNYWKYQRLALEGLRPSSRDTPNPVRIVPDGGGPELGGRMSFVDNVVDRGTGTIRTRARVDNPTGAITPGMFARVRLLGSGLYDALMIPDAAIGTDQTTRFVYVVRNGKAEYRPVTQGPLVDGLRVIRSGLTTRDLVVVSNLQRVQRGAAVKVTTARIRAPGVAS